ncbi:MAG: cell division protein FtsH, partial [Paraclostridium sp.]
AKDDLKKVTDIATQMVCEYGMSSLGAMTIDSNQKNFLSKKIQEETTNIINSCYEETLNLLTSSLNDLHLVSQHLFDKETMTHEELKDIIRKECV